MRETKKRQTKERMWWSKEGQDQGNYETKRTSSRALDEEGGGDDGREQASGKTNYSAWLCRTTHAALAGPNTGSQKTATANDGVQLEGKYMLFTYSVCHIR